MNQIRNGCTIVIDSLSLLCDTMIQRLIHASNSIFQYIMVKQHYHLHTSFVYRWVWEDEKGLHVGNLQTYLAWYEINVRLIGPIKTTLRYKMVKQEG